MLRHVTLSLVCGLLAFSCSNPSDAAAGEAPEDAKKYQVASSGPESLAPGAAGEYAVTITPAEGFVLKIETPFKAQLSGSPGVSFTKDSFTAKDFDDPNTPAKSIRSQFTVEAAGEAQLSANLSFFICNENLCERFKEKLSHRLAVK